MKLTRGISKEFAEAFKKCELYELYKEHTDELFLGVRNNYLNLYYNCDSIARITFAKGKISCEIDKYYLDGKHYNSKDKEKLLKKAPRLIYDDYLKIKENSEAKKTTLEKKAQSKLVLLNNANVNSNWFCLDIEYVLQFENKKVKEESECNGRFDIIAVSKVSPHKVALIELKYGSGAIGGTSGIYKHVEDFIKFSEKEFFKKHLKNEIIEIIKSQINLGISLPFPIPKDSDFLEPEFYFITLDNKAKKPGAITPKQTMGSYLFKDKSRWNSRLSVEKNVERDFGDITKLKNKFYASFLFSSANLDNLDIIDIIDGAYDERIDPE